MRKTLIVGELRIPKAQVGKPAIKRKDIPLVDLLDRPLNHLEMNGLVVDGLNYRKFTRQGQKSKPARAGDEEPGRPSPPPRRGLSLPLFVPGGHLGERTS